MKIAIIRVRIITKVYCHEYDKENRTLSAKGEKMLIGKGETGTTKNG